MELVHHDTYLGMNKNSLTLAQLLIVRNTELECYISYTSGSSSNALVCFTW